MSNNALDGAFLPPLSTLAPQPVASPSISTKTSREKLDNLKWLARHVIHTYQNSNIHYPGMIRNVVDALSDLIEEHDALLDDAATQRRRYQQAVENVAALRARSLRMDSALERLQSERDDSVQKFERSRDLCRDVTEHAIRERFSHEHNRCELEHRNEELEREKRRIVALTALLKKHTNIQFVPNESDTRWFEQYLERCDQHLSKTSPLSEMELLNRSIALAEENKHQTARVPSASGSSGMQSIIPTPSKLLNEPNPLQAAIISSLSSGNINEQQRLTNYNQLPLAILASIQFDRELEQESQIQVAAAASSRQNRRRDEQVLIQDVGEMFGVNLAEDRFLPLGMSAEQGSPVTVAAPAEPTIKQEEAEFTVHFDDYDNDTTNHPTNVESDGEITDLYEIDSEGYYANDFSSVDDEQSHEHGCDCLHCAVFAGGISSSEDESIGVADASPEYSPLAMRFPLSDGSSPLYSLFTPFGGSSLELTSTSPSPAGDMTLPRTHALLWQNPFRRTRLMFVCSDNDMESEDESPTKKRRTSISSASDPRRSPNSRFGRTRAIRPKMVRRNKAADLLGLSSIWRSPTDSIHDSYSEITSDEARLQVLATTQVSDHQGSEVDELDSDTSEDSIALSVESEDDEGPDYVKYTNIPDSTYIGAIRRSRSKENRSISPRNLSRTNRVPTPPY